MHGYRGSTTVKVVPRHLVQVWPLVWTVWGLSLGVTVTWGSSVSPVVLRSITMSAAVEWTNVTETAIANYTGEDPTWHLTPCFRSRARVEFAG